MKESLTHPNTYVYKPSQLRFLALIAARPAHMKVVVAVVGVCVDIEYLSGITL